MKIVFSILIGALFLAVLPLFKPGFIPTHDGEYHLIRFYEFGKMLAAGHVFPRWAPNLNSGYGVPLFNFHYPFPNYLGALYHFLGVSYPDAVKLVLATGYLFAVVFCFLWLSKLFDKRAATVGTIVYSFVPYWFVDIYVRGVVGEVLALTWVMFSLASIERKWKAGLAIAVGLLMISHNIMSLLFLPVLFLYIIIRRRSLFPFLTLGIGLASYFWIPALFERQYVVGLNTVDFRDHFPHLVQLLFPSWGTGFSQPGQPADEMSFQIGLMPLFVVLVGFFFLIWRNKKDEKGKKVLSMFFLLLCSVAFFLMQEMSIPIWERIPFLSYIQYPWRLLSLFLPATAFFAAYLVARLRHAFLAVALAVGAVVFAYPYANPVVYALRSDEFYLTRQNFTDGTSSMGNTFSTRWSDWKKDRPAQKIEVVNGDAKATGLTTSPLLYEFSVTTNTESRIRINTLYYPGWEVLINGKAVLVDYEHDGTITFSVLPGQWQVSVRFTETSLRRMANAISFLSLFWLVGWFILEFNAHRHRYRSIVNRA
jgi:uncharacterized membrane protein